MKWKSIQEIRQYQLHTYVEITADVCILPACNYNFQLLSVFNLKIINENSFLTQ